MLKSTISQLLLLVLIISNCSERHKNDRPLMVDTVTAAADSFNMSKYDTVNLLAMNGWGENKLLKLLDSLLIAGDTVAALRFITKENINKVMACDYGTLLLRFSNSDPFGYGSPYPKIAPNPVIVRFLLNHGANPNLPGNTCTGDYGEDCNRCFLVTCDERVAELLIKAGSKYQRNQNIVCASKANDKAAIKKAIAEGGDPTFALPYAYIKDREFFDELLNTQANKDAALSLACGSLPDMLEPTKIEYFFHSWKYVPDTSLIRKIVLKRGDPNIPLSLTVHNRYRDLARFLIRNGADKNTALLNASYAEDTVIIAELIRGGAKLIVPNNYEDEYSIAYSKNERVKAMVLPVTDGSVFSKIFTAIVGDGEDEYEQTNLIFACQKNELGPVEFMLKAGTNPNVYVTPHESDNYYGCSKKSALAVAIAHSDEEMVQLLKKFKARLPKGCTISQITDGNGADQ